MEGTIETVSPTAVASVIPTCACFHPYWEYMDAYGKWIPFYLPGVEYRFKAAIQLPNHGPSLLTRNPITIWINGQRIFAAEDMVMDQVYLIRNSSFPPEFFSRNDYDW
jgi:hypothetical protein